MSKKITKETPYWTVKRYCVQVFECRGETREEALEFLAENGDWHSEYVTKETVVKKSYNY